MDRLIKLSIDAMGGDNAPLEIVKGAVKALKVESHLFIYLTGDEDKINSVLKDLDYPKERVEVVNASEIIEMSEHPSLAIRRKKDSSMVVGMNLVKSGKADAFLSAGNSGAILVGGVTIIGRISGIDRAPFAAIIPTENNPVLIIDSGANVDVKTSYLIDFSKLGSIYMKYIGKINNPKVGILNIGAEDEKGNSLVRNALPELREQKDINFIGSVEARDVTLGNADVIVCDGFVGNVFLKTYEGVGRTLLKIMKSTIKSNIKTKLAGALLYGPLKRKMSAFDATNYGGAPLLGCKSLVMKCHGNATEKEISNACIQCFQYERNNVTEKIKESFMSLDA